MEQLKTDTQETKKKVLGGNTSGNLLNLVFREQSVPEQKQPNDLRLLLYHKRTEMSVDFLQTFP